MVTRLLGRLPRTYLPMVHMSALLAGKSLPPPPVAVDNMGKMPQFPNGFGMMLNDRLGDCTCAAFFHARQVWSFNATGTTVTDPDPDVLALYEKACGYNPSNPSTDHGGNEQHVLTYLHTQGAPTGATGLPLDKIVAFVEVDPRNTDDVKRTIADCGVAYIGFNVPQNIMPSGQEPPAVWTVDPSDPPSIGGHAVVLPGYDANGPSVISWGQAYKMTWDFFAKYVDEVYAIADLSWINATHKTPAGMTLAQLEQLMKQLKELIPALQTA